MLRTLFDPPLLQYARYGLRLIDPRVDVEKFLRQHRIAEVGRFAVMPEHRGNMMLVAALMRSATEEMVTRGYTHVITDVFEDDPHSPLGFHTRVMGFRPVATHDHGELNCKSRRITLLLDMEASYRRLKARGQLDLPLSDGALARRAASALRSLRAPAVCVAMDAAARHLLSNTQRRVMRVTVSDPRLRRYAIARRLIPARPESRCSLGRSQGWTITSLSTFPSSSLSLSRPFLRGVGRGDLSQAVTATRLRIIGRN